MASDHLNPRIIFSLDDIVRSLRKVNKGIDTFQERRKAYAELRNLLNKVATKRAEAKANGAP